MSNITVKKHKPIRSVKQNLLKILRDESEKLTHLMEKVNHKQRA
jgi:hypothetical protein